MITFTKRPDGSWAEIDTAKGNDTDLWVQTLADCCRLQPQESPFFSDYGVGSIDAIQTGNPPTQDIQRTQAQFSKHFLKLAVLGLPIKKGTLTYIFDIVCKTGRPYLGKIDTKQDGAKFSMIK